MDLGLFIEYLKQKHCLTDLEKDILDTWNELQKIPFDRNSAQTQILQNNLKHLDVFSAITVLPTTVTLAFDQMKESDFRYSLENQLAALAAKAWRRANEH